MNAFVRRLISATLPIVSAAALFAGSAPAHADLTLHPPPVGDSADCLKNGGTPEQCAQLTSPAPAPQGGVNPSTTQIRRIANATLTTTASSFGLRTPTQLIRAR